MKTFDISDAQGRLFAFEVSNTLLGRRGACRVVAGIPGVTILRRPQVLSWWREEVFCEFSLGGVRFGICEPYGDNSRYWIGPAGGEPLVGSTAEIVQVRDAFARTGLMAAVRALAP
jgi:hypothetical protein